MSPFSYSSQGSFAGAYSRSAILIWLSGMTGRHELPLIDRADFAFRNMTLDCFNCQPNRNCGPVFQNMTDAVSYSLVNWYSQ